MRESAEWAINSLIVHRCLRRPYVYLLSDYQRILFNLISRSTTSLEYESRVLTTTHTKVETQSHAARHEIDIDIVIGSLDVSSNSIGLIWLQATTRAFTIECMITVITLLRYCVIALLRYCVIADGEERTDRCEYYSYSILM